MRKIRIPNIFAIAPIIISLIIPTSYEAIVTSIPGKLVGATTDIAYGMREFYQENRGSYKYDADTEDYLEQISGFYDLDIYTKCGEFLDSNFLKRKMDEKTLSSPCLISYPLVAIDQSPKKQDVQFFYGCMIDGNKGSDCLQRYK